MLIGLLSKIIVLPGNIIIFSILTGCSICGSICFAPLESNTKVPSELEPNSLSNKILVSLVTSFKDTNSIASHCNYTFQYLYIFVSDKFKDVTALATKLLWRWQDLNLRHQA